MFDKFRRRMDETSDFGPQPQAGEQILSRARALGALAPDTARLRAELDVRHDPNWDALVACEYLLEGREGYFYLAHRDGSADSAIP